MNQDGGRQVVMTDQSLMDGGALRRFNRIVCAALAAVLMSAGWGWASSGGGWGGRVSRRMPSRGRIALAMTPLSQNGPQALIGGSTVTFYAAGTSGYGQGASVLATTTSNANGGFNISSYTCPAFFRQTYLTATGGNAGSGSNPAIAMMALSGPCASLTASSFVTINELSTVAAQWALAQFIDASGKTIGSSATNATGLANAVNLAESDLVISIL